MKSLISPCSTTTCCRSGRSATTVPSPVTVFGLGFELRVLARDVRAAVSGQRVGVRDDGPSVVHRQLALPGRHRGALRLERLDEPALADPPHPVVAGHLRDHLLVGEIARFRREVRGARALAVALLAVAQRALRGVDLLAFGDHLGVRPDAVGDVGIRRRPEGPRHDRGRSCATARRTALCEPRGAQHEDDRSCDGPSSTIHGFPLE